MRRQQLVALATAALLILSLGAAATAATAAQSSGEDRESPAELTIDQPHWVDDEVQVDTSGNYTTYKVTGEQLYITPDNFEESNVVDYGVQEDEGDLSRATNLDAYQFDATQDGTYYVYWIVNEEETHEYTVEEQRGNETVTRTETETETVQHRYHAQIQVEETTATIISDQRHQELQNDAANWTAWEEQIYQISGEDADVEQKTQLAANQLNLRENPLDALTGNFWHLGVIFVTSLGGIMWLLLFGAHERIVNRSLRKELNELRSTMPEMAELEDRLSELDRKEDMQSMATKRPAEWYDDPVLGKAATEAFGDNMLSHWFSFSGVFSAVGGLRDRIAAMSYAGYGAIITRDDGEIVDARLVSTVDEPDVAADGGGEVVALSELRENDELEAVSEAVDPFDDVLLDFDYAECDADRDQWRTEVDVPEDLDEMVEQLDVQLERYGGDVETFGQLLEDVVADVIQHPNTDRNGQPDELRMMLEQFYAIAIEGRDIFGLPAARFQADVLADLLADHDPVEEAREEIERDKIGQTAGD